MVNISYQWDPLNNHDYLHWWKYDGPGQWRAGCHFSDTIRRCFEPLKEQKIDLNYYSGYKPAVVIIKSLFYLTLCEHQAMLAQNAVCIHNRTLSDDMLRCSGVMGWMRGNPLMYLNKQFQSMKYISEASFASVNITVIQWKKSCEKRVDEVIRKL